MRNWFVSGAAIALGLALMGSASALAQPAAPPSPSGSTEDLSINRQLTQVNARIDRRLALGNLTQKQADEDHRVANDIQGEASDDRQQNGGHLTLAERFDLLAKINRLKHEIHSQRMENAAPPAH